MNDENDKPKDNDWGMTMPHIRLRDEKNADNFSDDFAPQTNPTPIQSPSDDWGMNTPNFNQPNNQPSPPDFDKTTPNLQVPKDVWDDEQPSTSNQPPTDDWGMTTPNVNIPSAEKQADWEMNAPPTNQPKQEKQNEWSMPEPVFRISEGEKLDDVAKRTMAFNWADFDKSDKPAPNRAVSENPPHESFDQTAPNINLQAQPNISEQFPAAEIAEEIKQPAKATSSKMIFIVGGLFAMFIFFSVFLVGVYFLFFNKPAVLTAEKAKPVREEQSETVTPPAPVIASETILPKEIQYKSAMVLVSAGEFLMGSDTDADESKPAHKVSLPAFYIDKYEVTNAEYKAFCDATRRNYPPNPHLEKDYFLSRPNAPVVGVSFSDAQAYADWAGKRLPTETEWEKAASWDAVAQSKRAFPWGNDFQKEMAAFGLDSISDVGKFSGGASSFGAMDMAGNVVEWVDAFFQPYPNSTATNAAFGKKNRVVRGGHFGSKSNESLKTTKRIYVPPDIASGKNNEKLVAAIIGFRCAVAADDRRVADALQAQGK